MQLLLIQLGVLLAALSIGGINFIESKDDVSKIVGQMSHGQ